MDLGHILASNGVDPDGVLVLRHRPRDDRLNKILPWLAVNKQKVFNCYQSVQGAKTEAAFCKARHVAAFTAWDGDKAAFAGLFEVTGSTRITMAEYESQPEFAELVRYGMTVGPEEPQPDTFLQFDLVHSEFQPDWRGKLIVRWPPPALSWYRWASRNRFPIHAITEESVFEKMIGDWRTLVLSLQEIRVLPESWKHQMRQWRGIYLIHDSASGRKYVGSAYGNDNICGRWESYARTGHGNNKHLKGLDYSGFCLSVLERLSPDMEPEEVIRREASWKTRLHTRYPDGLNGN